MFGVVPKAIWKKSNPPDDNNMCNWAMRCLLIEDGNRLILVDNGMGEKQDAKFFSYYYLSGEDSLQKSLKEKGFSADDITDVFLTHLHFDHCGGSIKNNSSKTGLETAFKNATYWSNAQHWEWATKPNPREKASFLKENILPIQESGQLKMVNVTSDDDLSAGKKEFGENISIFFARGHTDAMMLPHIKYKNRTVVFVADLLPSAGHIPLPYVMGYDTRPLLTMTEKEKFLNKAGQENYVLFLEHDPVNECCTVENVEGRVRLKEKFALKEI